MASEVQLKNIAQSFTMLMATNKGISKWDALSVVLGMLHFHTSLCMDKRIHRAFLAEVNEALQRAKGARGRSGRAIRTTSKSRPSGNSNAQSS